MQSLQSQAMQTCHHQQPAARTTVHTGPLLRRTLNHHLQQQQQKPQPTTTIITAAVAPKHYQAAAPVSLAAVDIGEMDVLDSRRIPLSSLASMAAQGSLQLQPQPQGIAWNSRKMASRLVMPVLQGKPTPAIVLEADSTNNSQLRVLGGSQRLSSLLAFVSGSSSVGGQPWPSAPVELESREDAFIRWNGKTFKQLPETTRHSVSEYPVECIIVRPKQAGQHQVLQAQ